MSESYIQVPVDSTGKKIRTIEEIIGVNTVHSPFKMHRSEAAFIAIIEGITPLAGLRLLTILNRNTAKVVRVYGVNVYHQQTATVTGVLTQQALRIITATVALAGGTAVTPVMMDTNFSLPANIDVRSQTTTTLTLVGELSRLIISGDETEVSTGDADAFAAEWAPRHWLWKTDNPLLMPVTLRTDGTTHQGLTLNNLAGTTGILSAIIYFTVGDE